MKKKTSIFIAILMLISIGVAILPTAEATDAYTIKGILYLDDGTDTIPAGEGVQIDLEFGDGTESTTTGEPGYQGGTNNYYFGFNGKHDDLEDQPGYFHIVYDGHSLEPEDEYPYNISVTIQKGVIYYWAEILVNISSIPENNPPNTPSNPSPTDGANNRGINTDLDWTGGDPDGDTVTYDIYFGTTTLPIVKSDHTSTSYNLPTLSYDTTYQWQIIAEDDNGGITSGPVWTFTTKEEPTSPPEEPPYNPPYNPPSGNDEPVADAGGPYQGVPGESIELDGSGSTDTDGTIESYSWDFGDGNTGTGQTVSHTYATDGTYTAVLTVEDDDGDTDTDPATVTILKLNKPPEIPIISGPTTGDNDTVYNFTAVSTDGDNDTIQYIFYWGDGTKTITTFLANATPTPLQLHTWATPGTYTVNVRAYDNESYSGNATLTFVIAGPSEPTTGDGDEDEDDYTMYYYLFGIILIIILLAAAYLATRKKEKKKK